MPKIRKENLPHHVKERLRHQKLQQLLEEAAFQVPKPSNERKETKAAKLRRVILYVKFLSKKKAEYERNLQSKLGSKHLNPVIENKSRNSAEKLRKKVLSFSENDYRKAQIIFLRKSSKSSDKKEVENCTDSKENNVELFNCCGNNLLDESQMNYSVIRKIPNPNVTDNVFNQRCDISEPEKPMCSSNQIKNIFYDDPPFSVETKEEESLKATYTYRDHFGELLVNKKSNFHSPIENTHATKFSSNFDTMSTNLDYQQSMSNNSICIDFNRQFQMHPKSKEDYSEAYKNNLDSDELTFHNNSQCYSAFNMNGRKILPQMSIFSPYSPKPINIVSNKEDEFYNFKSHQISNAFSKPEMLMQMSSELSQNELSSLNCATFSPDHNFSENLQSSGESAFVTSSNEWLSDDTINDSGNFAKSSCFDSPTNDTVMGIKSLPFQNDMVNSDCVPNFYSDAYSFGNEQFYELKSCMNSNSRHSSPLYKSEINERNAFFTSHLDHDRYHKTNSFQPWNSSDKNVLLPIHFSQTAAWRPYCNSGRKGKPCTIVNSENEDSCVPDYAYDINTTNELEEENIIDVSRIEEVNSCGNIPNFPLKSEYDDSPLPLKENSYSFKNFGQWLTKNSFE